MFCTTLGNTFNFVPETVSSVQTFDMLKTMCFVHVCEIAGLRDPCGNLSLGSHIEESH